MPYNTKLNKRPEKVICLSITMKEIAKLANVSTATVSKIVNGLDESISEEVKKRVKAIIADKNYIPNAVASSLKVKYSKIIGFVLPDIMNPFFPQIARGIIDVTNKNGYSLIICNTDDNSTKEIENFNILNSRMCDGIILIPSIDEENYEHVFRSKIPVVVVDREISNCPKNIGQVYVDKQKGIYESTKLLINKGCKSIAFISSYSNMEQDRFGGYCKALIDFGLEIKQELVYKKAFNTETGVDGMKKIIESNTYFDGVVCGNDLIAYGALKTLKKHKIKVPEQVKVIGFDDLYLSELMSPSLSTVLQPTYEIGRKSAEMLINNLQKGTSLGLEVLNYELVLRETT